MITAKYTLENESGERIDLTAPAPIFLVNVEGLGITTNITYGDLENGFFHTLYEQTPQNNITGDLIYQTTAFDNYQTIVNWISKAKTIYFCYQPLETEYRRIVKLNYIVKERRTAGGWMRAGISFSPLTPWYLAQPTEIGMGGAETEISKGYFLGDESSEFSFTQDLHGYDHPWPAGGGKNLWPDALPTNAIAATISGGVINSASNARVFAIPVKRNTSYWLQQDELNKGWNGVAFSTKLPEVGDTIDFRGNMTNRGDWTLNSGENDYMLCQVSTVAAFEALASTYHALVAEGSTATAWTPYENKCPITPGFTLTRDDDSELVVYAGYLDMDTQSIMATYAGVDLGTLTWTQRYAEAVNKTMSATLPQQLPHTSERNIIASTYGYIGIVTAIVRLQHPDSLDIGLRTYYQESSPQSNNSLYAVVPLSDSPSGEMVYPLTTPVAIQLTASEFERALSILGGSFGYRYTDDLRYGGDAAGTMSATITAAGHVPAAVVLRYTGAITNPRVRLVGAETGIVYGICALNESLSDGESFELSTLYEDSHVTLIEQDGTEENLLPAVNQAYEHYFRCPTTEASVLTIESDGAFEGEATLLVYNYYRSV